MEEITETLNIHLYEANCQTSNRKSVYSISTKKYMRKEIWHDMIRQNKTHKIYNKYMINNKTLLFHRWFHTSCNGVSLSFLSRTQVSISYHVFPLHKLLLFQSLKIFSWMIKMVYQFTNFKTTITRIEWKDGLVCLIGEQI